MQGISLGKSHQVSIIINCLNGEKYLREAIDSVFAQTFSDWEIVFWDNASIDESTNIAKSYGEKIKCYCSEETFSLGKARNLAFAKARGSYLAILDADDVWLPEKLEKQIPLFDKDPEIGLTFSDSIAFNEKGLLYTQFSSVKPFRGRVFRDLFKQNFISSETMIYSRKHLNQLEKMFNDNFSIVCDCDLSLRMANSFKVDFIEQPLSKWRLNNSGFTVRNMDLFHKEQEALLNELGRDIPDFMTKYEDEIKVFKNDIIYKKGVYEWGRGENENAREIFRKIKSKKCLISLCGTYIMPFTIFSKIISLRNIVALKLRFFNMVILRVFYNSVFSSSEIKK